MYYSKNICHMKRMSLLNSLVVAHGFSFLWLRCHDYCYCFVSHDFTRTPKVFLVQVYNIVPNIEQYRKHLDNQTATFL